MHSIFCIEKRRHDSKVSNKGKKIHSNPHIICVVGSQVKHHETITLNLIKFRVAGQPGTKTMDRTLPNYCIKQPEELVRVTDQRTYENIHPIVLLIFIFG